MATAPLPYEPPTPVHGPPASVPECPTHGIPAPPLAAGAAPWCLRCAYAGTEPAGFRGPTWPARPG